MLHCVMHLIAIVSNLDNMSFSKYEALDISSVPTHNRV